MVDIPLPPRSHHKANKLTDEEQEKRDRLLGRGILTKGWVKSKSDKPCSNKNTCLNFRQQYEQYEKQLFPVCPVLKKIVNDEKFDFPTIPKTKSAILNSIRKILSVRDVLVRLELSESTMVRCAHDANFLQKLEKFVNTKNITNLSRQLEPDFPDISEKLGILGGEFELAKQRYVMAWGGKTRVYLLPDSRWFQFCVQKDFFDWRKEISSDANLEHPLQWEQTARTLTWTYPAELKKVVTEICDKLRQVETVLQARMEKQAEIEQEAEADQPKADSEKQLTKPAGQTEKKEPGSPTPPQLQPLQQVWSIPLSQQAWAEILQVSRDTIRCWTRQTKDRKYHFDQVSPRKWRLPINELPSKYSAKYQEHSTKNK